MTSHRRNEQGFEALQEYRISGECLTGAISCLGLQLDRFAVTAKIDNRYLLEAVAPSLTEAEALYFLDQMEVALTAHFGAAAANAYYGTPYVEFDRFNLELLEEPPSTPDAPSTATVTSSGQGLLHDTVVGKLSAKLSMRATENCSLSSDAVASLACNSLRQLYADGLRATTAESKFFHWFIILEEFLEKSSLKRNFTALFTDQDKAQVRTLADVLGDGRKKGHLMDVLEQKTLEARHEKLAAILTKLGISTAKAPGSSITVNPECCKKLIKQRNTLFHEGAHIDDGLLYNVLFPIVTELASRSKEIIALR
jgi:hypothetical protein